MDERIDILDSDGKHTGTTELKSYAHRMGLFHATVHIWFYTPDGKVLLQQRGKNKDTHPLLWDVSVAGHIGAGEEVETAAIREIKEEIGFSILRTDLRKIGVFKSVQQHTNGLMDCEFHHTFLSELKVALETLRPQDAEVALLTLISIDNFSADVLEGKSSKKYVPHSLEYYKTIFNEIKNSLK